MALKFDFNKRYRTFMITINEKTFLENDYLAFDKIEKFLKSLKPDYCACCFENGSLADDKDESQNHIHVYLEFTNARTGESMRKKFVSSHFDVVRGNPSEIRDYIFKEGKHNDKKITQLGSFEFGNWDNYKDKVYRNGGGSGWVDGKSSTRQTSNVIKEMVSRLDTVEDFIMEDPALYQRNRYVIDVLYNLKNENKFKSKSEEIETSNGEDCFYQKNLKTVYIWGGTGTGKTYGVQKTYGNSNVSIITTYPNHSNQNMNYDEYKGTPVMVFDEFRSSIKISEMLVVLDRTITDLRCRYANKKNLADSIFLLTNIPFHHQYKKLQEDEDGKRTFEAFERRFTGGIWFMYYSKYLKRRFLVLESEYLKEKYPQISYDFACPLSNCEAVSKKHLGILKYLDEHYLDDNSDFMVPYNPDDDPFLIGDFVSVPDGDEFTDLYYIPEFYADYLDMINGKNKICIEEATGEMPF